MAIVVKWLTHLTVNQACVGSSPIGRPNMYKKTHWVFFCFEVASPSNIGGLIWYSCLMKETKRIQTLGEEIANAVSHGIGAIFGIVALILFILASDTLQEYVAGIIFASAIFLLFISSTLYHSFPSSLRVKRLFKRFDHISIYLLIGASFAPLLLVIADQPFGIIFFSIQWTIITVGIVFKAILIDKLQVLHIVMFLLLGWSALLVMGQLGKLSEPALYLTVWGGIAYSLGVVFYASSRKFMYAHFVWHLFVIAGVVLHFIANYGFIFLPTNS